MIPTNSDRKRFYNPFFNGVYCSSGINYESTAKTALHTTEGCTMYNQVPDYVKNGTWEWISE